MGSDATKKDRINQYSKKLTILLIGLGVFMLFIYLIHLDSTSSDNIIYNDNIQNENKQMNNLRANNIVNENIHESNEISNKNELLKKNGHQVTNEFDSIKIPTIEMPIDILNIQSDDPTFKLCKLDFHNYWKFPYETPMFKDRVKGCKDERSVKLSQLNEELVNDPTPIIEPNGFVFHESRVGSTLVANELASDPYNMVYSESTPPVRAITSCKGCKMEHKVHMLREIVKFMGKSPFHKRLFFKFQSATVPYIDVVTTAFPNTPWIFLFRDPVQTMMSHCKGGRPQTGTPCMRSKSAPTKGKVLELINRYDSKFGKEPEAWCAGHLAFLCESALNNIMAENSKGIPVDYDTLPEIIHTLLLPYHFKAGKPSEELIKKMKDTADHYSKARSKSKTFSGDSKQKEAAASKYVKKAAETYMLPSFQQLHTIAESHKNIFIEMDKEIILKESIQYNKNDNNDLNIKNNLNMNNNNNNNNNNNKDLTLKEIALKSNYFEAPECPDIPPSADIYPKHYEYNDILKNWNPDELDIPNSFYGSLCRFSYAHDQEKAQRYRNKHLPFILYDIPEMAMAEKKWEKNDYKYLKEQISGWNKAEAHVAKDNHFMYFHNGGSKPKGWEKPFEKKQMSFDEFLNHVKKPVYHNNTDVTHYYLQLGVGIKSWVTNDLPFFNKNNKLFIYSPKEFRSVHCRFGASGEIAESHYDGHLNMVAMVFGVRRWIMAHPRECSNIYLYPKSHPSGRHSAVDWSKPDYNEHPNFKNFNAFDILLLPGDVLYVPSGYLHYVINLDNVNGQCNARSGMSDTYFKSLNKCGFH